MQLVVSLRWQKANRVVSMRRELESGGSLQNFKKARMSVNRLLDPSRHSSLTNELGLSGLVSIVVSAIK